MRSTTSADGFCFLIAITDLGGFGGFFVFFKITSIILLLVASRLSPSGVAILKVLVIEGNEEHFQNQQVFHCIKKVVPAIQVLSIDFNSAFSVAFLNQNLFRRTFE